MSCGGGGGGGGGRQTTERQKKSKSYGGLKEEFLDARFVKLKNGVFIKRLIGY